MIPAMEQDDLSFPSLGMQVCDFIQTFLVHGPGDLRGAPVRLSDEKKALICRAYEVYPRGHPQEGRRRFRRVAWSLRKGAGKTEDASFIACCELHPDGPVRTVGWDGHDNPIGGGVTDPYLVMLAYTEEQTEELAYGALRVILEESALAKDFDIGLERIMRKRGDGTARPFASSPNTLDGLRMTWVHYDETHRFVLPRLRAAHRTTQANLPKRRTADAWALETTTAPVPGENSVAEDTLEYARAVADGRKTDDRLFVFHRQASDAHDLTTREGIRSAVIEASGPVAEWSDIDAIVDQWFTPGADVSYLERVWLNRSVASSAQAFDVERWRQLQSAEEVPPGAMIALGFDGSRYHDSTGIIATEIRTGYQWVIGAWEKPFQHQDWEVPESEVVERMEYAFSTFDVWRLYADPPYWETMVSEWSGQYGHDRVIAWRTNRERQMVAAVQAFCHAITDGDVSHDGDRRLTAHVGNSCKRTSVVRDEKGEHLFTIVKERPDSPRKIDLAIAAVLSYEARRDALAAGVMLEDGPSKYETEEMLIF